MSAPVHSSYSDALNIPVRLHSDEAKMRAQIEARGQFLARQDRWADLGHEIRTYDQRRSLTPGGMSCAELLAIGARSDVVRPISDTRHTATLPLNQADLGLAELEQVLREHPNDYGIGLVIISAYIDLAWRWRGEDATPRLTKDAKTGFEAKMALAQRIQDQFIADEANSPCLAATRCALLAAKPKHNGGIEPAYAALLDRAPRDPKHLRALGNHMLPRWFGSYQKLEIAARKALAQTESTWGNGAYTWVYLDAISLDPRAIGLTDPDLFQRGLKDILDRQPDQHTVNLLAAFCAVTLAGPQFDRAGLRDEATLLASNIEWITKLSLREVHPLIWAAAQVEQDGTAPQPLDTLMSKGRSLALHAISQQFVDQIARGLTVHFTPTGVSLQRPTPDQT